MRVDTIQRSDIIRWRDSCTGDKEARFNRALPVLAAMLKYAEQLGYIRKGSNPCRGTPRFKREAMERFLSPVEYRRLGLRLADAGPEYAAQVTIIRLLLYTGARMMEIGGLQWDWVQPPATAAAGQQDRSQDHLVIKPGTGDHRGYIAAGRYALCLSQPPGRRPD